MVPKPSVPTENIIRNGKIVALGDKELLNKLSPLVEYNKLEAVKFLINHFSGHSELNMTFKDWALLVDTIPAIEKSISHPPRDLVTSSHLSEQGRPQPTIRTEPLKPAKTSRSSARLNSSGWEEVDHAIIGIDSIHDIFGDHEDFPSFVVGSMSMDGFSVTLKIKAWSFKTDKRYIISLLFNEVTYYHASLYLNNEQSFRIVCKKDFGKYKYKVGDSNIYINSSKAIVLGISEL